MELLFPPDAQRGSIVALDVCPHFPQQLRQVGHFRLARGVFNERLSLRQCRSHQNIFRAGDRNSFKHDVRALQSSFPRNLRRDVTVFCGNLGAHFFQRCQVQVHGPGADGAPARQRDPRGAGTREQRPERQDGSPHGADQVVRRLGVRDALCFEDELCRRKVGHFHARGHVREQLAHGDDVAHARDIAQLHGLRRQQGCGHRRQGGVLCAADGDAAFEAVSPFDGESVHEASSCWTCGSLSERAAQIVFREREPLARGRRVATRLQHHQSGAQIVSGLTQRVFRS